MDNKLDITEYKTVSHKTNTYQYAGNLTHVIVYNAGHMVRLEVVWLTLQAPYNQPENTLDLLMGFIAGQFM